MTIKSEPIFVFDAYETMQLLLSDDSIPYTEGYLTEQLNGDMTLEFKVISDDPRIERIVCEGRLVTRNNEGHYKEFIIREVEDDDSGGRYKRVFAEGSEFELIDAYLFSYVQSLTTLEKALSTILQGTRWKIGEIDNFYENNSVNLKHMSKRKAVNELINIWGGEVQYRVEIDGRRIVNRYIDVFKARGQDTGKRFEADKDIVSTNRVWDSADIKTALVGLGESDEYGERLTFANIEWKKSKGDPVDKPKGVTWVGDPEALAAWGYKGSREDLKNHRFGIYDGQEKDPATLLLNTWNELQDRAKLRDTYEVDVIQLGEMLGIPHEQVNLGDGVRVVNNRMYPDLRAYAAIVEYKYNLNDPGLSEVLIGHFRAKLDTDSRLGKLEKDYNDKRGEWESKPSEEQMNESIAKAKKELEEAISDIEQGGIDLETAKKLIQDTIDNPQDYKGTIEGLIIAKELIIQDTVTASNATITGRLTASELTLLEAAIERANIIDANIQDATITGELIGVSGTFGKVVAKDEDGFLLEKDGLQQKVAPENNLLKNHNFEVIEFHADYGDERTLTAPIKKLPLWKLHGTPRTNFFFVPEDRKAYPAFGQASAVVRDANFISQQIDTELKGNATYTISAHFKKAWNEPSGKPRFEVDLMDADSMTMKKRLVKKVFDPVPDDYSVVRLAETFNVPRVSAFDYLIIKISGGDDNWVQCDGAQLVQSNKATTYIPEEGVWDIINGKYDIKKYQRALWGGLVYPTAADTIKPTKKLTDCENGWILQFQRYVKGDGKANNNFQFYYVPKAVVPRYEGYGYRLNLARGYSTIQKYVYISDDKIVGHDSNNTDNRHELVMTEVYEW